MNIKINSVRFSADKKLEEYVQCKVEKLTQFYDNILKAEVFLRLENNQSRENKVTEIKLDIPGSGLFVKKQASTFEAATDNAIQALSKQVKKYKEKKYKK